MEGPHRCSGQWDVFLDPSDRETAAARADRVARAKAICATCDEQDECLAGALARREPHDVYGGLTAEERAPILKRMGTATVA